jgi:hypothetical protein
MYASNFVAHVPGCRHVTFGGISHPFEGALTAGGIIKNLNGKRAIVFVNFAPRRDEDKALGYKNGRPFVGFYVGKTFIVVSDESEIWGVFDLLGISYEGARLITCEQFPLTQFRSAYVIPHVVRHFFFSENNHWYPPHKPETSHLLNRVLFRDRFGNLKVVLSKMICEVLIREGIHNVADLTDVPNSQVGLTEGSSIGVSKRRISELVIKGESMGVELGLSTGDHIDPTAVIALIQAKNKR